MTAERQTVAGAYEKIEAHEDLCALRYKQINDTLADVKDLTKWIRNGVASVGLGLVAWMALQLYSANNARISTLEHQPSEVHQTGGK